MKQTDFRLKKVKVEKNLVTVDYTSVGSDKEYTEKSKVVPHPDLKAALTKFTDLVLEVFDMPEDNQELVTVNGIVCSQKNNSEQVMVLSSYETASGAKVAINTPNISLDTDHWTAQQTMGEIAYEVEVECYKYLFDNKAAQLEMPFEEGQTDDQSEEKE